MWDDDVRGSQHSVCSAGDASPSVPIYINKVVEMILPTGFGGDSETQCHLSKVEGR